MREFKPKTFNSFEHLEYCVQMSMPDCYPAGMAKVLAKDMLKNGDAKIATVIDLIDAGKNKQ